MSHTVKLLYLGKKTQVKLDMQCLRGNYVFGRTEPVDVDYIDAEWLTAHNPKMFRQVRGDYVPKEIAQPVEKVVGNYVCPKCGADFTMERLFKDHMKECPVPDWEVVEDKFKCNLCDKEPYSDWEWFEKHMSKKHDIIATKPDDAE